jgi:predicted PurR-regulated permease PerM
MIALLVLTATGASLLSTPAAEWMERAPQAAERIEQRLEAVNQALRKFVRATERVEEFARGEQETPVTVQGPGLRGFILNRTWQFAGGAATLIFLLYFLLASGDLFLRRMVRVLPRLRDKKIAVAIARRIQADITRYLFTVTLINTVVGVIEAVSMSLLAMPNPVLWGVLAGILNFIPYLGPAVTLSILAAVALLVFEDLGQAMLRPLTFLVLTTLEGQLLTPYILGRRLMLNPVVIFVSLILWSWLWGIAGALLAVPLTMVIKIVCDAVPSLAPVGTFLAR